MLKYGTSYVEAGQAEYERNINSRACKSKHWQLATNWSRLISF
jgi:hypothetical protein